MKIYILIPVHNFREVTLECLRLMRRQTYRDFEVIVADDGSTDGTSEAIAREYPEVTVLHGDGNLWWSGATNLALKHALRHAGPDDYMLALNNDVSFEQDYLERLAEAAHLRPGWLIGSVALDVDNPQKVVYAGAFLDWRTLRGKTAQYTPGKHFNDNVSALSGRGMLIPAGVFEKVGVFDAKRLPQYAADSEFSIRAQRAGFPLCVYCGAVVHSDTSITGHEFSCFTRLTWREAWRVLFDKKSRSQISTRYHFFLLCSPRRYLLRHLLTIVRQTTLILTSVPPLWCVKMFFRPILERFRVKPSE